MPATTLRYYEDLGLLHPQRVPDGYRLFDPETLKRLRFITAISELSSARHALGRCRPAPR